jgi:hypothetical protein
MGKKPLIALAGLCLAGAALCGCQQDKQSSGNSWRKSNPGGMQAPPPSPPPGSGNTTGATGWDNSPSRNLTSRPGASDFGGGAGAGMTTSPGLGSGTGANNGFGSSGFGSGTRQPVGGLPSSAGTGFGNPTSMTSNPTWGGNPAPVGNAGGIAPAGGDSRLAEPPPMSSSLTGNATAPGMGGASNGLSNSLTPPPPPVGARPAPMTGGLNLGGDPPPGAGPTMNQSNLSGSYRTVPPALGEGGMPPAPPVPTMKGNGFDQ